MQTYITRNEKQHESKPVVNLVIIAVGLAAAYNQTRIAGDCQV